MTGTVRLWDVATGQPIGAPMKHDGQVRGTVINRAGDRIRPGRRMGPWDVTRLRNGNLVELACRLLADQDISRLEKDFGIKVKD
jgi:hypothetical protein